MLDQKDVFAESAVTASYIQVYNNEIQDLQAANPTLSLEIKKGKDRTRVSLLSPRRLT